MADERIVQTQTEVVPEERVREERPVSNQADHRMNVAERVVWLITGVIMGLLALRFLLRLLGANAGSGFADFIYTVSYPFAAPFFGLFSYDVDLTTGRFEFETLIAILVYALLGWLIARVTTLGKR